MNQVVRKGVFMAVLFGSLSLLVYFLGLDKVEPLPLTESGILEEIVDSEAKRSASIDRESIGLSAQAFVQSTEDYDSYLQLVSDAGVMINAIWIHRDREWSVERLSTPGRVHRNVLEGADLIAPVGHLPERPSGGVEPQHFGAWAKFTIQGVPNDWHESVATAAPVLPDPRAVWHLVANGGDMGDSWSCLIQPGGLLLDAPSFQLEEMRFPFKVSALGIPMVEVEISLAKGTELVVDYSDLKERGEFIDVPLSIIHNGSETDWTLTIIEDNAGGVLANAAIVNNNYGTVTVQGFRSREYVLREGEPKFIPHVHAGAGLTLYATSSDNIWYAYQGRARVSRSSSINLIAEKSLTLNIVGAEALEAAVHVGAEGRIKWWLGDGSEVSEFVSKIEVFKISDTIGVSIRLTPSIWQLFELGQDPIASKRFGFKLMLGDRFTGGLLDIPQSRDLNYMIRGVQDDTVTIVVKKSLPELEGLKYVTFASDHNKLENHDICGISMSVAELTQGLEGTETRVKLRGDDAIDIGSAWIEGTPHLLVLDWEDASEYYFKGEDGRYQEIPLVEIECNILGSTAGGPWKVSWAFGCERNQMFPIRFPLDSRTLPARVFITVPVEHAFLCINKQIVRRIGDYTPISFELEIK